MTVAVVVPCRNEAETIGGLLDAVFGQTRPPDELVIVDDGSTDGTAQASEQWRQRHLGAPIRIVPSSGRGAGAAMNTGIADCLADVIVRLDGHSIPARDYIECSLDALRQPDVCVVGGVWVVEPGAPTVTARAIAKVVSHPLGSGGARYRHAAGAEDLGPMRVETVPFGTFRRSLWRDLGGFDEALGVTEDYDFNHRARRTGGGVVLDPRIRSVYLARPTLRALARQYHRYGFWKLQMLRKDPRALHLRQIPPALLLPWVLTTAVWAATWPGVVPLAAAVAYPAIVVAGALHVAFQRRAISVVPAAAVAFAAVHLAWSAGFVRAALGLAAPSGAGR